MEPANNNSAEKPSNLYVDRDVLGLEKSNTIAPGKAYSSGIFIVLLIALAAIAVTCWLMT